MNRETNEDEIPPLECMTCNMLNEDCVCDELRPSQIGRILNRLGLVFSNDQLEMASQCDNYKVREKLLPQ